MSNLDDAIAEPSPECYKDPFPRPYPDIKFITVDGKTVGCVIDEKREISLPEERERIKTK